MTDNERQRFIESWEARRAGGKMRFILRTALFYFVGITLLAILFDWINHSLAEALAENLSPSNLTGKAIFGLLMSSLEWYPTERLYRKLIDRQT